MGQVVSIRGESVPLVRTPRQRVEAAFQLVRPYGLTAQQALLLIYVAHRDDGEGVRVNLSDIMYQTGMAKEQTVVNALVDLERRRILAVARTRGRPAHLWFEPDLHDAGDARTAWAT